MYGPDPRLPSIVIYNLCVTDRPSTLPCPLPDSTYETFFTANAIVNAKTGVAKEYPKLKLGVDSN